MRRSSRQGWLSTHHRLKYIHISFPGKIGRHLEDFASAVFETDKTKRMDQKTRLFVSPIGLRMAEEESSAGLDSDPDPPSNHPSGSDFVIIREARGPMRRFVYKLSNADPIPVLLALTKSSPFSTRYSVIDPSNGVLQAKIKGGFKAVKYSVTGKNCTFVVEYSQRFIGQSSYRSFTVAFPDGRRFYSKPPVSVSGNYLLDFHDMDNIESVRNFICLSQEDGREVCLLARLANGSFAIRVCEPFSVAQGFCLAMTSFHTGVCH
jgi:hypothetical protein